MTTTKGQIPMTSTIPGVREQVRTWTGGRTAKAADGPQRETLDARKLTILGSVGRATFATAPNGRELRLKGPAMPHAIEEAGPDAILVHKLVRSADGRQRTDTYLASEVEPGTFEKLRHRKTYTPRVRPPSPVDRDHELRAGLPRQPVKLGKDADTPQDIIKGAMSRVPSLMITDGRPPLRNVADEIADLERSGVALALSDDGAHLLATSPKGLSPVTRAMLDLRAALYGGHLKGEPVRCVWPHPKGETPDAVTYAVGGSPTCAAHLAGTTA